jgi:hypothetical protein
MDIRRLLKTVGAAIVAAVAAVPGGEAFVHAIDTRAANRKQR